MNPPPTVSVIIPTFNRCDYLSAAVNSVLGQSYRDFDLFVIDDGSTDRTSRVIKKYGDALTYIRQDNRGPSAARNRGIRASDGCLVAFLDSDDSWMPDKLLHQVRKPIIATTKTTIKADQRCF